MSSRDLIPNKKRTKLGQAELKALAEFRYQIRRYLRYMEKRKYGHAGITRSNISCCLPLKACRKGRGRQSRHGRTYAIETQHHGRTGGPLRRRRLAAPCQGRSRPASGDTGPTPAGKRVMEDHASASRAELQEIGPVLFTSLKRLVEAP